MPNSLSQLASRITALEKLVRDLSRSSRLANSSIENGAITVYDAEGTPRGSVGMQEDGTVAVAAVNGPPPPTPTAPTITSVLGGVAVSWDGTFTGGSAAPADFAYLEVRFATAPDFPGDGSLFSAFYSPTAGTVTVPTAGPLWVRLTCVSTSGVASAPSAPAGPAGPAPVVADAVLDGIVTELALADGAVSAAKLAAAAVESDALAVGAVTTVSMTAGSINGDRLAVGTIAADRIAAASITASQIKALAITGDRLAVNTITADKLAVGTITAASGVISSIDASKITTGTITGTRVQTAATGNRVVIDEEIIGGIATGVVKFTSGQAGDKDGSIVSAVSDNSTQMTITAPVSSVVLNDPTAANIVLGTDGMGQQVIEFNADEVYMTSPTYFQLPILDYVSQGNLFHIDKDWTTPALAAGYSHNGNSNGYVQYRVITLLGERFVQWRGGLNLTYPSGSLANDRSPFSAALPSNARPSSRRTLSAACSLTNSTHTSMKIDFTTDGGASIVGPDSSNQPPWLSLNGLMYSL